MNEARHLASMPGFFDRINAIQKPGFEEKAGLRCL
jgi:hypothetical protein